MSYPTTPQYVDRTSLVSAIDIALTKIKNRQDQFVLFELYGLAGVGKTRVLREVEHLCTRQGLRSASIGFVEDPAPHYVFSLTHAMISLFRAFEAEIGNATPLILLRGLAEDYAVRGSLTLPTEVEAERLFTRLRVEIGQVIEVNPFVLLIDHSEHCHEDVLNRLGNEFILPLFEQENAPPIGVFIAGHGPRVAESRWNRMLKRPLQAVHLTPLDASQTEQHVKLLEPDASSATEFYDLSQGHPYSTEALVYWVKKLGIENPQTERLKLAGQIYEQVIQQYILRYPSPKIKELIEVACVPRRFNAPILIRLLPGFASALTTQRDRDWYTKALDVLQDPPLSIIVLDDGMPARQLEPTLRKLLHTALAILGEPKMLQLHTQMLAYWRDALGERKPLGSIPSLAREIIYHTVQIATLQHGSALREAQQALDELLDLYFSPLKDAETLDVLKRYLSSDPDLGQILGTDGQKSLVDRIENYVQSQTGRVREYRLTLLTITQLPPAQYQVHWHSVNNAVVFSGIVDKPREFSLERWRAQPQEAGRATFRLCLPKGARTRIQNNQDWAIQITTNWTGIPWELMHDDDDFLCLSRPIGRKPLLPSDPVEHPPLPDSPLRALVVGSDPDDRLQGITDEVFAVKNVLEGIGFQVDLLWGNEPSSRPGVKERASAEQFALHLCSHPYHLIHYAGHAVFAEADPEQSRLIFRDGPFFAREFKDGLCAPSFIFFNACDAAATQTIQDKHGIIIEGLAISALLGGARACLGPMWRINDRVACEFALAFYRQVKKGVLIGEAIRRARIQTRTLGTDTWASWVLYGDPLQELL